MYPTIARYVFDVFRRIKQAKTTPERGGADSASFGSLSRPLLNPHINFLGPLGRWREFLVKNKECMLEVPSNIEACGIENTEPLFWWNLISCWLPVKILTNISNSPVPSLQANGSPQLPAAVRLTPSPLNLVLFGSDSILLAILLVLYSSSASIVA